MILDQLHLEFHAIASRPGWFRTPLGDWTDLEVIVLRLQDSHRLNGWQLICGSTDKDDGHAIYAIEGITPVEAARAFGTGSHNAWPVPETERVCDELSRVFEIVPFRPYFVDAAGYKCRFARQIKPEEAAAAEQILTAGVEGYLSRWSGEGSLLADAVIAENELRLWWD